METADTAREVVSRGHNLGWYWPGRGHSYAHSARDCDRRVGDRRRVVPAALSEGVRSPRASPARGVEAGTYHLGCFGDVWRDQRGWYRCRIGDPRAAILRQDGQRATHLERAP